MLTKEQRIEIARKFARKLIEKFGNIVKSVVVFGSTVRGEIKERSDIDILIIIDDTSMKWCPNCKELIVDVENAYSNCPKCNTKLEPVPEEYIEKLDEEFEKIAKEIDEAKIKIKEDGIEKIVNLISLQPAYLLTEFWDYVRQGHPIVYNFIKDGLAVYDTGFFKPLQKLWLLGKIPTTREAIEKYLEEAPKKIIRAKSVKLLQIAEDCFYAIVNSAQAVLMFLGKHPPAPSVLYQEFKKALVDTGIVEEEYAQWINEIVELRKKIEHQEIREIDGNTVDLWIERAEKFVRKMIALLSVLEIKKVAGIISKTKEVSDELMKRALKELNVQFDESTFFEKFKKEFIDKNLIPKDYLNVLNRVNELYTLLKTGKLEKIDFKEVYELRENVRFLIRDVAKVLKNLKKE